jgi:prevent-host-death family protein
MSKSRIKSKSAQPTATGSRRKGPTRRKVWAVQDARAHLSEVIDAAMNGQPQEIRRAGKEAVVVVSAKDYKSLTKPKQSLSEFFRNSPLAEIFGEKGIPEVRHKERLRDIDFGDMDP